MHPICPGCAAPSLDHHCERGSHAQGNGLKPTHKGRVAAKRELQDISRAFQVFKPNDHLDSARHDREPRFDAAHIVINNEHRYFVALQGTCHQFRFHPVAGSEYDDRLGTCLCLHGRSLYPSFSLTLVQELMQAVNSGWGIL